nr:L-lactate dehydrogenase [Sphingomonas sp. Y57]
MKIVSPDDFRLLAKNRLPPFLFEYLDGGANGEVTLARNRDDLAQVVLDQRVLRTVKGPDPSVRVASMRLPLPVILGPIGLAGMNARRGECQAARAAAQHGVPFCLSTVSACSLGEVASSTPHPIWFQLYMMRDRGLMAALLEEAQTRGCAALIFTVDMPVPGIRYRDYRSGLAGLSPLAGAIRRIGQAVKHPRWAWDVGVRGRPHVLGNVAPLLARRSGLEDFMAWMRSNFDPDVSWSDLEFVRRHWRGPLIIKGILNPHDAREAAALGADAIVVSNHGGRQLDGAMSTARALPEIAQSVGDRIDVLVDGGVRSGVDVVRMLALGAKAVLLGRAWACALAAQGERGVIRLIDLIDAEIRTAMALNGACTVDEISGGFDLPRDVRGAERR